ncbi:hypothetical protein HH195_11725 (plasmid) [Sarcina sp. JB2]|uniref:Uncharacterized protein n=1 Tax=Candidatus Sarcina troglodytae TaxID=2726954 RepID=A0ACD1BGT5_9CLOT|nr:hypothetical protein [Sarcina sp. JB2]QPJ86630.1 hypothetical protein HH195_11725 [Sarcina sp. JB2]
MYNFSYSSFELTILKAIFIIILLMFAKVLIFYTVNLALYKLKFGKKKKRKSKPNFGLSTIQLLRLENIKLTMYEIFISISILGFLIYYFLA